MRRTSNTLIKIAVLFCLCSLVEYIEFLFVRTDQTIFADNIGTKIFCILAIVFMLNHSNLRFSNIGFRTKRMMKSIVSGLALGMVTFGISYLVEILILQSWGNRVSLEFFITNFALTGATTQVTVTATAFFICITVNILNVLAEEGLFRGIILKLGADRFGFVKANWIQAALFGVWHIVMVVLSVYDGHMNMSSAIVMAIGYVILAGILGLEWGMCVSISGTLWVGISEHFFNNFIGNTLHVVTESGTDELQIARIILSNVLSLAIVCSINSYMKRKSYRRNGEWAVTHK